MHLRRTGIVVLTVLLMGISHRVQASCDQPVTTAELVAFIEQAELSVGRDAQLFGQALEQLENSLPCVDGLIGPELAARIHRAQGLRSFVAGAGGRSVMAFAAARRIEPGFRFPESVFPSAHPVPRLYEQAAEVTWQVEPVVAPHGSTLLWLDGVVRSERPVVAPAVAQYQRDGEVVLSAYVWPEDDLPVPPPVPAEATLSQERRDLDHSIQVPPQRRRAHLPLVVGAGLTALAGAGSYALAYTTARDYRDNPHSNAELERLRGRANSLVYVSVGLGAVAVGTGVGAAVTWPR